MCVRMGSPRQGWDVGQVMGALFLQVLVAQGLPWAPLLSQGISQEFPGWTVVGWELGILCSGSLLLLFWMDGEHQDTLTGAWGWWEW